MDLPILPVHAILTIIINRLNKFNITCNKFVKISVNVFRNTKHLKLTF